ncbi:hypothetical protein IFM89_026531 [Coptis chinensis]|uniref:Uncharacterized protein n=1 Tax=Coptis chinensis TaxID=261450 RepID=A0A835J255_9MAGN|nr:hypothetical protein IFM89_026531 [Coptis chinensis]
MTIMSRPHLLVIPYPAQGHDMPLMELSYNLVHLGFKISFINTEYNHKCVTAAMSNNNDYEDLIHLVSIPDGMEPGEDRNELGKLCDKIVNVMPGHLEDLINKINGSNNRDDRITCVIADENMCWTAGLWRLLRCCPYDELPFGLPSGGASGRDTSHSQVD